MSTPGVPSPRDVQDIIPTRLAGAQPAAAAAPEPATRATEPDAATRLTAADTATRQTDAPTIIVGSATGGTRPGSTSDAPTVTGPHTASAATSQRFTGSFSRLGRTRTNAALPRDTQELDLRLQLSRPSVLADLGRVGSDSIPPNIRRLIDEHGTEGRYAIDKPLAQGGMGAVLLIKDGDFQRPAAMKVMLSQHAANPEALERFLAEAQVTAQLEHPNIVPIHDLGILEDGTVYFTMKFIEGESLGAVAKRLRSDDPAVAAAERGAWPDERILMTFLKVLDGLGYAHARGVVHRDIKPDNIMLGTHGEVLVVDWGIAKVLGRDELGKTVNVAHLRDGDEALSLTRDGSVMGTFYYMAPEQARGDIAALAPPTDIYALGATLYELLTGRRPVGGGSAADIIAKVIAGDIAPPVSVRPGLHEDLAAIVMKAMATDSGRRYQRCADFADDLRRFLAGQAVVARRRNLIERIGVWVARHRRQVALGAAGLAVAGGAVVATLAIQARADAARADAALAAGVAAAGAGRWDDAVLRASEALAARPGDRAASELRARAVAEQQLAARAAADRDQAARLAAEAVAAADARRWEEALDRAKAALALAPVAAAQDALGRASAALADARRAAQERLAAQRKDEGDGLLARARALPPLDPGLPALLAAAREAYALSAADGVAAAGVEAAMAELGALQARSDAAREAAARTAEAEAEAVRRRLQADESIAAGEAALARGDADAALAQAAAARRLVPGDERAAALRERAALAAREQADAAAAAAARAQARRTAGEAMQRAGAAVAAMRAALGERATLAGTISRLEDELKQAAVEAKDRLFTARAAARAAEARVAEQWALAEGAARTALDSVSGDAEAAEAGAARSLLIELYRGRLQAARAAQSLPEVAAFENLLRRLGADPAEASSGTVAVSGPAGAAVAVRRLDEDAQGRLVAGGDELGRIVLPGSLALPAGRYLLSAGDETAAVVVEAQQTARLAWAPGPPPAIPGIRLRWLPLGSGAWLAEDEVTVRTYAGFLADPPIAAEVRASYAAWQAGQRQTMPLLPRQGAAIDEAVWQLIPGSQISWRPHDTSFNEPVRGVARPDAEAFCAWLARRHNLRVRLPTLAEWRFAATGGDLRRVHPWGPGFDHGLATSAVPKKDGPPAVGSAASDRGPFGHRDLAGGVREWVADRGLVYAARIAGGAWTDEDPARLRSDSVESLPADASFNAIGFRILVEP
jgi:tRNA A-37 threonylcarbamoyl transferase component Bud32